MKHLENRRLWHAVIAVMLALLALVGFWPSPVDQPVQGQLASLLNFLHAHGIPSWLNYQFIEATANVLLFFPLGVVAGLAYRNTRWWQIGALSLVLSGCIELGQLLFLHNRFASPLDLVTNTSGAVMGVLVASAVLSRVGGSEVGDSDPAQLIS